MPLYYDFLSPESVDNKRSGYIGYIAAIIGIILGCILGNIIGNWNMRVLSYLPAHFYEGTSWIAIGAGAVVAAFLALVNALIAMRRIKNFKLTDINK